MDIFGAECRAKGPAVKPLAEFNPIAAFNADDIFFSVSNWFRLVERDDAFGELHRAVNYIEREFVTAPASIDKRRRLTFNRKLVLSALLPAAGFVASRHVPVIAYLDTVAKGRLT